MKMNTDNLEGLLWQKDIELGSQETGIVTHTDISVVTGSTNMFTKYTLDKEPVLFKTIQDTIQDPVYQRTVDFRCFKKGIFVYSVKNRINKITAHYFNGEEKELYSGRFIAWHAFDNGILIERVAKNKNFFLQERQEILAISLDGQVETIAKTSLPEWISYGGGAILSKCVETLKLKQIFPPKILTEEFTEFEFRNFYGNRNKIRLAQDSHQYRNLYGSRTGMIAERLCLQNKSELIYLGMHGEEKILFKGFCYHWQPCGDGVAVKTKEPAGAQPRIMDVELYDQEGKKIGEFERIPNTPWRAYG